MFLIWATSTLFESGKALMEDLGISDEWNSMEYDYVTGDDYNYRDDRIYTTNRKFYTEENPKQFPKQPYNDDRPKSKYTNSKENQKQFSDINNRYRPPFKSTAVETERIALSKSKPTKTEKFKNKEKKIDQELAVAEPHINVCWVFNLEQTSVPFYFTGCAILALLQFLLFSPNLNMAFNLLFSLWRIQKYEYRIDCILTFVFVSYGLVRLGLDLHNNIRDSVDRWVKMNLMELANVN